MNTALPLPTTIAWRLATANADAARPRQAMQRKAGIQQVVGRIARAEHPDVEVAELLVREVAERLERGDIYGDLLSRPASETIALLCRDLGLHPDWSQLAQEAWAQDEMKSGAPGSPLAAMMARGRRTEAHGPPRTGSAPTHTRRRPNTSGYGAPSPSRGEGQRWGCARCA